MCEGCYPRQIGGGKVGPAPTKEELERAFGKPKAKNGR